jgi:hypothetical protein
VHTKPSVPSNPTPLDIIAAELALHVLNNALLHKARLYALAQNGHQRLELGLQAKQAGLVPLQSTAPKKIDIQSTT